MRDFFIIACLASIVTLTVSCHKVEKPGESGPGAALSECGDGFRLQDGDIIFQTSMSSQSQAVQLATHSRYSHMGMVYIEDGTPYVFEASAKVRLTPIRKWIDEGEKGKFVIKRISNRNLLTSDVLKKMKDTGEGLKGRSYDLYFEWSDDKMYCSELVYKVYSAGGIELGKLAKIKDFDLTHPAVRKKMNERFGDDMPYDETVISPDAIFNDSKLAEVCSNY
jgi:hypothetical protein